MNIKKGGKVGNKKKEEVENNGAENIETENSGAESSGREVKAVGEEPETQEEKPSEDEGVKEETSQDFQSIDPDSESSVPSEVTAYALQNVFTATLADGVFNSLVTNAYLDNFLSKDGLTVQMLENQFDQNGRGTIFYALQYLMGLNIAVHGKADECGKRYYQLQKDFTKWKPVPKEVEKL